MAPRSYLTQLTLGRLGRAQVEAMTECITGGKALPAEVVQQIVAKTDGVPLFVEELTKAILESGLLREYEDRYELTSPIFLGFYASQGALTHELGEQLSPGAHGDLTHFSAAHTALGNISFFLGDYAAARAHFEQGIVRIDLTSSES